MLKLWGPFIFLGSVIGVLLAHQLDGQLLSLLFAVVALLVAIKMMLPLEGVLLSQDVPRSRLACLPPLMIGGLSSMIDGTHSATADQPSDLQLRKMFVQIFNRR